jgi:hypothetical protein
MLHDLRRAGEVTRYHTWPTLRQQSIAEHTWQLLRIYLTIFGPPSPEVTTYIMFHDCGEIAVGDAPYPSKAQDRDFKDAHNRLEDKALEASLKFWSAPVMPALGPYLLKKIKLCEYIEMAEEGLHEYMLGSRYGWITAQRCFVKIGELGEEMTAGDWVNAQSYLTARFDLSAELFDFSDHDRITKSFKEYLHENVKA